MAEPAAQQIRAALPFTPPSVFRNAGKRFALRMTRAQEVSTIAAKLPADIGLVAVLATLLPHPAALVRKATALERQGTMFGFIIELYGKKYSPAPRIP